MFEPVPKKGFRKKPFSLLGLIHAVTVLYCRYETKRNTIPPHTNPVILLVGVLFHCGDGAGQDRLHVHRLLLLGAVPLTLPVAGSLLLRLLLLLGLVLDSIAMQYKESYGDAMQYNAM